MHMLIMYVHHAADIIELKPRPHPVTGKTYGVTSNVGIGWHRHPLVGGYKTKLTEAR